MLIAIFVQVWSATDEAAIDIMFQTFDITIIWAGFGKLDLAWIEPLV